MVQNMDTWRWKNCGVQGSWGLECPIWLFLYWLGISLTRLCLRPKQWFALPCPSLSWESRFSGSKMSKLTKQDIEAINPDAYFAIGLDDAIIGIGHQCNTAPVVIYDYDKWFIKNIKNGCITITELTNYMQ